MSEKKSAAQYVRRVGALLATVRDEARVRAECRREFGVDGDALDRLIADAKADLATAADVDLRAEFATRRAQLEDVRERAKTSGDLQTELKAIQELAKICGLYKQATSSDAAAVAESASIAVVREHLEGIGATERDLPIEELARLVALKFLDFAAYEANADDE